MIPSFIHEDARVKLRDGRRAQIYRIGMGAWYPIHGVVYNDDGTTQVMAWDEGGHYHPRGEEHGCDIVGTEDGV